jgi:ATP-dependent Clp protease ATP-binding subunit ClpA
VQRLIGTGCSGEGVLTSRLREQPFAVVLLDEFEKAHPMSSICYCRCSARAG